MLSLLGFVVWLFGNARFNAGELAERDRWKDAAITHERDVRSIERGWMNRLIDAQATHTERIETIRPVVLTNKETVTRYAETPAGRALCLAPDRVPGIEQARSLLFADTALTAGESAGTVPADAPPEE